MEPKDRAFKSAYQERAARLERKLLAELWPSIREELDRAANPAIGECEFCGQSVDLEIHHCIHGRIAAIDALAKYAIIALDSGNLAKARDFLAEIRNEANSS
jgi:hypothetical protein